MPRFVTALYDDVQQAQQATEALQDAGFHSPDIQLIDEMREAEGFFDRLFLDENGGGKRDDGDIRVMGISPEDIGDYRARIHRGGALVIAMCDGARIDDAVAILEGFDGVEIQTPDKRASEARQKKRGDIEPGQAEERRSNKWFHVVDIEQEDPDKGARSHAVHVRPRSDIDHQPSNEMPGATSKSPFPEFERECRVHYSEYLADSGRGFDDYELAYRYGLALAENRSLAAGDWDRLRDHARRGWEDHVDRPWEPYEEAVRFGWRAMRRRKRSRRQFGSQ